MDVNALMAYKNKNRNIIATIKVVGMFALLEKYCCIHCSELKTRYFPVVMCNETRCAGRILGYKIRPKANSIYYVYYFVPF